MDQCLPKMIKVSKIAGRGVENACRSEENMRTGRRYGGSLPAQNDKSIPKSRQKRRERPPLKENKNNIENTCSI